MNTILHISASIRGTESVSRTLGATLVSGLAKKTGAKVIERVLSVNELPFIDAARFAANGTPPADRSEEQEKLAEIADELIAELVAADTIVLSVPIYNFGVPAIVKAWADLVARAGTTFTYTPDGPKGLLEGKTAYIAAASGGTQIGSDADFMTPWLRFFLGFIGIHNTEIVAADGIMGADGEAKIAQATETVQNLVG